MKTIALRKSEVKKTCIEILKRVNTPHKVAQLVVEDLIENELTGYPSHGVMRIFEYFRSLENKHIDPRHEPRRREISSFATVIEGNNAFGRVVCRAIENEMKNHLKNQGFGFVSLINNTSHIGRLSCIASPVAESGGIVFGCSNYSGSGQIVSPYGGAAGRLCTNPLVFAAPRSNRTPLIVDMTTSSVSEGKVRLAYLQGKKIPKGWAIDAKWRDVFDPARIYSHPPTAFIAPLGGKQFGFKGFGLALMAEILSGVFSGGGYARKNPDTFGNSAFFLVLSPEIFGGSRSSFEKKLDKLLHYILSTPRANGFDSIRIPGKKTKAEEIVLSLNLWNSITHLSR